MKTTDASASWGPSGEEFVFHTHRNSDRNKEGVELFISPDPYGDGQRSISAMEATEGFLSRLGTSPAHRHLWEPHSYSRARTHA